MSIEIVVFFFRFLSLNCDETWQQRQITQFVVVVLQLRSLIREIGKEVVTTIYQMKLFHCQRIHKLIALSFNIRSEIREKKISSRDFFHHTMILIWDFAFHWFNFNAHKNEKCSDRARWHDKQTFFLMFRHIQLM